MFTTAREQRAIARRDIIGSAPRCLPSLQVKPMSECTAFDNSAETSLSADIDPISIRVVFFRAAAGGPGNKRDGNQSSQRGQAMLDTPRITQTATQTTAIIRLTIPKAGMQDAFGPCVGELMAAIASQGIEPVGSVFTHHLKIAPEIFDFELCVRVSAPVVATGRVEPSQWPAMRVAQTVYQGSYEGLPAAWDAFMDWIEAEGHAPAEDLWECYVAGPHTNPDPATWRTQLNRPLAS